MEAGQKGFQCNGVCVCGEGGGGGDKGRGWGLKLATEILLLFTLCQLKAENDVQKWRIFAGKEVAYAHFMQQKSPNNHPIATFKTDSESFDSVLSE